MVYNIEWSKGARCDGVSDSLFFEAYEADPALAADVDSVYCNQCPIQRECLSVGVGRGEWGVWGGVYLEAGKISDEFNAHKTKDDWGELWLRLTTLIQ